MPTYRCKIAQPGGQIETKTLVAKSEAALKSQIEKDGAFLLKFVDDEKKSAFGTKKRARPVKFKDFVSFNQEFAVLLKAGLPVVKALDTIVDDDDKINELNLNLKHIRDDIATGESISNAFGKYPKTFPSLYIASLQAGEKSGNIPISLIRFVEYMKKTAEIKKKVITASIYPSILVLVSLFVLTFLLIFVVPTFTENFMASDSELPYITSLLIGFSNGIKSYFIYVLLFIVVFLIFFSYFNKTNFGRRWIDQRKLQIPVIGNIVLYYAISKMTRTLSTILSGGMSLIESLEIASKIFNNVFLEDCLQTVIKKMTEGQGFSDSLKAVGVFPKLTTNLISAGEGSGALVEVLNDIANFYDDEVDVKLSILTSSIEPVLMVVMGFLIGFIVLAMYMPIFQLAGAIK